MEGGGRLANVTAVDILAVMKSFAPGGNRPSGLCYFYFFY